MVKFTQKVMTPIIIIAVTSTLYKSTNRSTSACKLLNLQIPYLDTPTPKPRSSPHSLTESPSKTKRKAASSTAIKAAREMKLALSRPRRQLTARARDKGRAGNSENAELLARIEMRYASYTDVLKAVLGRRTCEPSHT